MWHKPFSTLSNMRNAWWGGMVFDSHLGHLCTLRFALCSQAHHQPKSVVVGYHSSGCKYGPKSLLLQPLPETSIRACRRQRATHMFSNSDSGRKGKLVIPHLLFSYISTVAPTHNFADLTLKSFWS